MFAILIKRNYYRGFENQFDWTIFEQGFFTRTQAKKRILEAMLMPYHLSHNEAGRPSYRVVNMNKRNYAISWRKYGPGVDR